MKLKRVWIMGILTTAMVMAGVCSLMAVADFVRGQEVFVQVRQENLRDSPKGQRIAKVDKGARLLVLEQSGNWVKVRMEGWIWQDSVTDNAAALEGDYRAFQIIVKRLSQAEDILKRLRAGEKFSELAKKYSLGPAAQRGGDLGYFKKGDFQPEFEQAILKLERGQYSEIIQSKLGYHIFMRAD